MFSVNAQLLLSPSQMRKFSNSVEYLKVVLLSIRITRTLKTVQTSSSRKYVTVCPHKDLFTKE